MAALLAAGGLLAALAAPPAAADDMMEFEGIYRPTFFVHWLDARLDGATAYVAGLSGLSLLDVGGANPPAFYGRYEPAGGVEFYRATPTTPQSYCSARDNGIWVIGVGNPVNPTLTHVHTEGGVSFEDVLLDGSDLYAAAHESGLRIYDVTVPTAFAARGAVGLTNAWALAKDGPWVYVADGAGGLRVIDATDPGAPLLAATAATSGAAQDVDLRGDRAYVACAAAGLDIFDIQQRDAPLLLGHYDSAYSAFKVAADPVADRVYVASWDIVDVVDASNPAAPVQAGLEDTPVRAMGVTADADLVYVADWASFRMYSYGPTSAPDVQVTPSIISFPVIPIGESADTTVTIGNTGGGTLVVDDILTGNSDFAATPTAFSVPPDGSQEITVTATASTDRAVGALHVVGNDPDEGNERQLLDYGTIGALAQDFTLQDLGGVTHSLTDYRGDVVLLAFFASW